LRGRGEREKVQQDLRREASQLVTKNGNGRAKTGSQTMRHARIAHTPSTFLKRCSVRSPGFGQTYRKKRSAGRNGRDGMNAKERTTREEEKVRRERR
jgi:hypothetical protein